MGIKSTPTIFHIHNSLGSLELAIMKIIWQKEKISVREVLNILKIEKPIAYTTVMTVMNHLHDKNFLDRIKVGKTYYYNPAISRNSAISKSFSSVFRFLISDYGPTKILTCAISNALIPKNVLSMIHLLRNKSIASFSMPASYSLFLTLCTTLFGLSIYDLFQNLQFFGSFDYLNLIMTEPSLYINKLHLLLFAFIESLPIVNILTSIISFIMSIYLVKKLSKLLNFKIPSTKLGGVI